MDAKDAIKSYLQKMADEDSNFKERFEDKKKKIDECFEYIKNQARKESVKGSACVSDEIVYGWAVHYYQEENLEVEKNTGEHVEVSTSKKEAPVKKHKAAPKEKALELDLFGGLL